MSIVYIETLVVLFQVLFMRYTEEVDGKESRLTNGLKGPRLGGARTRVQIVATL